MSQTFLAAPLLCSFIPPLPLPFLLEEGCRLSGGTLWKTSDAPGPPNPFFIMFLLPFLSPCLVICMYVSVDFRHICTSTHMKIQQSLCTWLDFLPQADQLN